MLFHPPFFIISQVTVEVRAPSAGKITKIYSEEGTEVNVGEPIMDLEASGDAPTPAAAPAAAKAETAAPAKKEAAPAPAAAAAAPKKEAAKPAASAPAPAADAGARTETRVKMTRMRQRIAQVTCLHEWDSMMLSPEDCICSSCGHASFTSLLFIF